MHCVNFNNPLIHNKTRIDLFGRYPRERYQTEVESKSFAKRQLVDLNWKIMSTSPLNHNTKNIPLPALIQPFPLAQRPTFSPTLCSRSICMRNVFFVVPSVHSSNQFLIVAAPSCCIVDIRRSIIVQLVMNYCKMSMKELRNFCRLRFKPEIGLKLRAWLSLRGGKNSLIDWKIKLRRRTTRYCLKGPACSLTASRTKRQIKLVWAMGSSSVGSNHIGSSL